MANVIRKFEMCIRDSCYTNLPSAGAMRGYGAPQVVFAVESMLDDAATALGLSLIHIYSLKQIAIIKGIDYKTVSYHKIRALNKLNIKGTVELFIACLL